MSKIWRQLFFYSLVLVFTGPYVERAELNKVENAKANFLDLAPPVFLSPDSFLDLPVDSRQPASSKEIREVVTKAFKVQLSGLNKENQGLPAEIINQSNGYTATIFGLGDRYQTDYIHLNDGMNLISIVWPSGVKEWVRVNSQAVTSE